MPSLRRTISSPSVRSSPYPASLGVGSVRGGHGPRRSSGSDTSQRRVLADIEWWRVVDGQQDLEPEHENEETDATAAPSTAQDSLRSPADTIADALADYALEPASIAAELALQQSSTSGPSEVSSESQREESAAHSPSRYYGPLGLGPRTPARREASGSSTYSTDSSYSLDSSPDSLLLTPRDNLSFTFSDMGFADPIVDSPTMSTAARHAAFGAIKSYSFAGFSSSKIFDDNDDDFYLPTFRDFAHEHEDLFA